MEEALLNDDISAFDKYIDEEDFNVNILGLEAKIFYYYYINENTYDTKLLLQEWESIPGDLRLFNICRNSDDFFNDVDLKIMLQNKTLIGITDYSFVRLCSWKHLNDPDYFNKLMTIYDQFSDTGILHKHLLQNNKFHEYLELSGKYQFTPNSKYWNPHLGFITNKYNLYLSDTTMIELGLDHYSTLCDINTLREWNVFPDLFHKVYVESKNRNQSIMRDKVIFYFDQLLFEERTTWINIIKPFFNARSLRLVQDKDTFDVFSKFINFNDISNNELGYLSDYCRVNILQLVINKLSGDLVNRLKLYLIINFDDGKIKHFFGEVIQEDIDNLVRKLI